MSSENSGGDSHGASSGGDSGSSSGGSKLVLILSIVNLLATLGMLALLFISFKKDSQKPSVEDIVATADAEHGGAKSEGHGGGHGGGGHGEAKTEGHGGGHGEAKTEGHGGGHGGGHGESKKSSGAGQMVTLDQFTVNLSTPGSTAPKFVKANITIEVPTEDTGAEVSAKMPQVRNTIIDLFNSKRPSDLSTVDGREYIKDEIKNALNTFLVSGKVKGVFFTSFALQG